VQFGQRRAARGISVAHSVPGPGGRGLVGTALAARLEHVHRLDDDEEDRQRDQHECDQRVQEHPEVDGCLPGLDLEVAEVGEADQAQ